LDDTPDRYNVALVLRLSGDGREREGKVKGGEENGGDGREGEGVSYSALSIMLTKNAVARKK